MDAEKLKNFVMEISNIKTTVLGSEISSAGFAGTSSSSDDMLHTLKSNVAAFASEYTKTAPKKTTLEELAAQIEGGLHGLQSVGAIDDNKFDQLISRLHDLKS